MPDANNIWLELGLILVMIVLNGFFAGSEIAVVSSRRSRLDSDAKKGKQSAALVLRWLKEPERFLATVQVGITLVGVLGSALGGAAAVEYLEPRFEEIPLLSKWAEPAAMAVVVSAITYLTLIIGELLPKSLALTYRERMATAVAVPIFVLSKIAKPLVQLLTSSTRLMLRLFGQKDIPKEMFVSEEEIRFLIREGASQGVFDQTEQRLIPKVFDFSETRVKDVMIGRDKITALDASTPREKLLSKVAEEGFTRLPIMKGSLDDIIGIMHMKDLIHMITLGQIIVLEDLVRPAVFVKESTHVKELLDMFQKKHLHMAVVQDAAGKTVGLVTLEDVVERIVGDIKDEHDVP